MQNREINHQSKVLRWKADHVWQNGFPSVGGISPILEMKEKEGLLVGSSCVMNEIFAVRDELIG